MKFEFEKKGRLLVVKITGELDHHSAAPLREETDREILGGNYKGLIIDLSGLDMMDSSGIGIIMGRYRIMEASGGHLCVCSAKPPIKKIILLSGLGKLIGICEDIKSAAEMLNRKDSF